MPDMTHDDIKAALADNTILAISIDTAVFHGKKYDFQNPSIRALNQFLGTDITLVLSDVVVREMKRHVAEDTAETQRAAKKAIRSHARRWGLRNIADIHTQLHLDASPTAKAWQIVDRFMAGEDIQTAQVPTAQDTAADVLNRYFASDPPFVNKSEKKHEFPDAFALLSLEAWARDNETKVLCVSPDKGWKSFCSTSEHLICIDKLDTALSLYNAAAQELADPIVEKWREGTPGAYTDVVSQAFEERLLDLAFNIDATTDTYFESEALDATLQSVDPSSVGGPVVIASDAQTITFYVSVNATISFSAMFYFSVRDGIDGDMIHLGSEEAETEVELPFNLTIRAHRVFENTPVFDEVVVSRQSVDVDFGYVEVFSHEGED